MKIENWKEKAYLLEIIGLIIYTGLVVLAMIFYTGGTATNPNYPGYNFWGNTISDSGRSVAYSGQKNTVSMILLSSSLIFIAIVNVPFFLALRHLFLEDKLQKYLSLIGTIFGIIASLSLIGIAFTPADILIEGHMLFVYIRYSCVVFMGVFYSLAMYMNKEFPRRYTLIFIIFTIIFFILSIMGLVGIAFSRTLTVFAQKLGWFATTISFLAISYAGLNLEKSK
ncbi:MAG: hypothetical protein EU539_12490 [Promethearchaeota archaeon]|nr:MAG: hypothetical protein EU539_12490 [Candidatus Lokiarchaeota archaeon]